MKIMGSDATSVPAKIVYIPEGVHTITPTVDGKPKTITVSLPAHRGSEIAAKLNSELERRQSENVRPIIDFDHRHSGPAAGIPKSFSYESGVGLILEVDWSQAGRSAVEGRDYSYFSPEFLLGTDGTPEGIPSRGPVGALVNSPAFRSIPRIAAADNDFGITDSALESVASLFAEEEKSASERQCHIEAAGRSVASENASLSGLDLVSKIFAAEILP